MEQFVEVEVVERHMVPVPPIIELPAEDGEPLESPWHRAQINLLIESVHYLLRGRADYFVGGNMFIYYSAQQVRSREYKGPDFLFVQPTDGKKARQAWVLWEEDGQYPNLIIELLSPTTASADLGFKKDLYERRFKTPEYLCFDPATSELRGWRLSEAGYAPLAPNDRGQLWSKELQAFIGLYSGVYQTSNATWLRLFNVEGGMIPTAEERAAAAGV